MAHYEIEVKSLLGEQTNADALKTKMFELDPACACVSTNKQLNHYFEGGDINELYAKTHHLVDGPELDKFNEMLEKGSGFSVRTRQRDDEVLLVVKASIDAGNDGINAVARLEFEEVVAVTLDELDTLVLESGYTYDSKWSREREEYEYKGLAVTVDRNAGYGYVTEFEKVTDDADSVESVRQEIYDVMAELGLSELPHDRHDRMYAHYKANWPEYYGTEKTFIIE